ncbi:MAG: hypothetical protein R3C49_08825 [Planctomycetaceae bacterium]
MALFWCSPTYLVTMAAIGAALGWSLKRLLKHRQRFRRQKDADGTARRQPFWMGPALAVWALMTVLYLLELGFAAFVDTTDAFNATLVSARWFQRHVDPHRNSEGFRDARSVPGGRSRQATRVFFVGDSFTIAQGVNNMQDRFTERTEVLVNQRAQPDSLPVHVHNFGEFGWEVSVIEAMVQAMLDNGCQPHIIVYVYMLNDIEGYDPRTEEAIQQIQQSRTPWFLSGHSYFVNWLQFLWQQKQAQRTVDYFPHLADSYREAPWTGVTRSLELMQQSCEQHDVELRMVFFPFLHNLGPDYPFRHAHQQLAEFCIQHNIRFLDLEPLLSQHADESLVIHRYDNHPNERCHALVATAIANELLNDLPRSATATPSSDAMSPASDADGGDDSDSREVD